MPRISLPVTVVAVAALCTLGAPAAVATAPNAADAPTHPSQLTRLPGSVAPMASGRPDAGVPVAAGESESIQIWLAGRPRAAQRYVTAASTPGSAAYRHFLSPSAYTARFGPSAAQVSAVTAYLRGEGFSGVQPSVNADYVTATGSAATVDRAFRTQLRSYTVGGTAFAANDRALSVPRAISGDILAVTGLDSARPTGGPATTAPAVKPKTCSTYWAQKTVAVTPAFDGLTEAAVPVCGYTPQQMRAAYGLSAADTGAGETIALIQVWEPSALFRSLTVWARRNRLPAPSAQRFHEEAVGPGDDKRNCIDASVEEAPIDTEAAYAMAPQAAQLVVHSDNCAADKNYAQALADALLTPLTGHGSTPAAQIESSSYSLAYGNETVVPASQRQVIHQIALRAAAEGVSLLVDAGDSPGVEAPPDDPDLTAVGGTTLGIGAQDQRLFETGWSVGLGQRALTATTWQDDGINVAGGGGVSSLYPEPAYQRSVVPAAMATDRAGARGRTVPDLAADGDPNSGMLFGEIPTLNNGKALAYSPYVQAGTSMATPLVAGIVADADHGQPKSFGFLNPLLYSLAGTSAFHDVLPLTAADPQTELGVEATGELKVGSKFVPGLYVETNDDQGVAGTTQMTAPGYDTMTGLGSPDGQAFITALRRGRAGG